MILLCLILCNIGILTCMQKPQVFCGRSLLEKKHNLDTSDEENNDVDFNEWH